jgi:acyl carrier protein
MSLRDRLVNFLENQNLELIKELKDDTPLIGSGFLDSLALFNLATWIEQEIDSNVSLMDFDLEKEWYTISDILNFIEKHQNDNVAKRPPKH